MANAELPLVVAQNRMTGGELWQKCYGGGTNVYRESFHVAGELNDDWFKKKPWKNPNGPCWYPENPLRKQCHNVTAVGSDHSRRLFGRMAKPSRSHSEGSLLAIREVPEVRRFMAERYAQVMKAPAAEPGPPRPSMRERASRTPKLPPVCEAPAPSAASSASPPLRSHGTAVEARSRVSAAVAPPAPRQFATLPPSSALTISAPELASRLAAAAPAPRPAASALSACAPSACGAVGDVASSLAPSTAWTESDFYSWRPRLIM